MNSIKTVVMVTVLLAVGYAVYTQIYNNSGPSLSPNTSETRRSTNDSPGRVGAPAGPPSPADSHSSLALPAPPASPLPPAPPASPPKPAGNDAFGALGPAPVTPNPDARQSAPPSTPPAGPEIVRVSNVAPPTGPDPQATPGVRKEFAAMMASARKKLDQNGLAEVLKTLSPFYGGPDLSPEESQQLTAMLDPLAGTVIYSREHHLEQPYRVKAGDSIEQIAREYNVPWQLLAKINGLRDPKNLRPDQELKVVRGPFEAVITLSRYELLLKVGGFYAGRFAIGVGAEQQLEGTYSVRQKLPGRPYYGRDRTLDCDDPANPFGKRWIGLSDEIGLHGTNDPRNVGRSGVPGTICLGDRDVDDVYDILSIGSTVTIRR